MNKEKRVDILNRIIIEVIKHSGDAGGAYYCNGKKLLEVLNETMIIFGLDDEYKIEIDNYHDYLEWGMTKIQIVKKGDI